MRELKFRAWHKKYKKMYDVSDLHMATIMNGGIWATVNGRNPIEDKDIKFAIQPKDIVVMQYAEVKDSTGKEIYESDIVHLSSDDGINYDALMIFKDGGFCAIDGTEDDYSVRRYGLSRYEMRIEVIGNMYENPELLKSL